MQRYAGRGRLYSVRKSTAAIVGKVNHKKRVFGVTITYIRPLGSINHVDSTSGTILMCT
jgi:hypothetical protein